MRQAALHIFALAGIGIAQPIYDLFSRHADFFVAHAARPADLFVFVVLVSGAIPALLLGLQALATTIGERAGAICLRAIVGLLTTVAVLPLLDAAGVLPERAAWLPALLAIGITFAAAEFYRRSDTVRRFLTLLFFAAPVFPLLFLFGSPVRELLQPASAASPGRATVDVSAPVVILVLDELPLASLLSADGQLDAERYPGFARFAADAHWFRNATTVAERTTLAIPALLTGRYPDGQKLATLAAYPDNLFTLFANSHRLAVFETHSRLCPENACDAPVAAESGRRSELFADAAIAAAHVVLPAAWTTALPPVTQSWRDFGAGRGDAESDGPSFRDLVYERRFDSPWLHARFLESISAGDARALYFLHLGMPHVPWRYLPSGREYRPAPIFPDGLEPDDRDLWSDDAWAVAQATQRHLLQVAYADRLVDETLDALERAGLYDDALVAIVSDHGVGLQPGDRRRSLTPTNAAEILAVPLFIKLPGQRAGVVSDRNAQTIDLLPSLADALGFQLPWQADGRSLFGDATSPTKTVLRRLADKRSYERLEFAATDIAEQLLERVAARQEIFASGAADPSLYAIGPHSELLGVPLAQLQVADRYPRVGVALDPPSRQLEALDRSEAIQPVRVTGSLQSRQSALEGTELAIVLNGRLRATTRSRTADDGSARFSAMLPESALVDGRNSLEIFVLRDAVDGPWLEPTWRAGR